MSYYLNLTFSEINAYEEFKISKTIIAYTQILIPCLFYPFLSTQR